MKYTEQYYEFNKEEFYLLLRIFQGCGVYHTYFTYNVSKISSSKFKFEIKFNLDKRHSFSFVQESLIPIRFRYEIAPSGVIGKELGNYEILAKLQDWVIMIKQLRDYNGNLYPISYNDNDDDKIILNSHPFSPNEVLKFRKVIFMLDMKITTTIGLTIDEVYVLRVYLLDLLSYVKDKANFKIHFSSFDANYFFQLRDFAKSNIKKEINPNSNYRFTEFERKYYFDLRDKNVLLQESTMFKEILLEIGKGIYSILEELDDNDYFDEIQKLSY